MVETATAQDVRRSIERDTVALVNVLAVGDYEDEHIPNDMNIPYDKSEERFPEEFDRSDEIIVYSLDESCQASPETAATLEEIGFENVRDYEEESSGGKNVGTGLRVRTDRDSRRIHTLPRRNRESPPEYGR